MVYYDIYSETQPVLFGRHVRGVYGMDSALALIAGRNSGEFQVAQRAAHFANGKDVGSGGGGCLA